MMHLQVTSTEFIDNKTGASKVYRGVASARGASWKVIRYILRCPSSAVKTLTDTDAGPRFRIEDKAADGFWFVYVANIPFQMSYPGSTDR